MVADAQSIPEYAHIPGVKPVPVVDDWKGLSREEFAARTASAPLLLRGLGSESRAAKEWGREFFGKLGQEWVTVATEKHLGDKAYKCSLKMPLAEFMTLLDGPDRVYIGEWYLFRKYPSLMKHVIDGFPAYLLDDWMTALPNGWAFNPGTRNNCYWGTHGTGTICHYDNFNTVTWNATLKGTKRWLLFSCRGLPRALEQPECWRLMTSLGIMKDGFVTPEGIERYLATRPPELPPLDFYQVDVPAGSTLFVPWKFGHQVRNIGECLAVSRYYVSEDNYEAFHRFAADKWGPFAARVLHGLVGTDGRRELLRRARVRSALETTPGRALFALTFNLGNLRNLRNGRPHFMTPDEKETPLPA